jgi:hypothetical protein
MVGKWELWAKMSWFRLSGHSTSIAKIRVSFGLAMPPDVQDNQGRLVDK